MLLTLQSRGRPAAGGGMCHTGIEVALGATLALGWHWVLQGAAGACVWHRALAALSSDARGAQGPAGLARGALVEKARASCRRKRRPVSSPSASCQLLVSRAVPGQLLPCCHRGDQREVLALFPRPPHSCHCLRKCRSEEQRPDAPWGWDRTWACPSSSGGYRDPCRGPWRLLGCSSGAFIHASAHHAHGH